ncbi:MAG: TraB/GumN family protein [Saprospiraceae bacterium]
MKRLLLFSILIINIIAPVLAQKPATVKEENSLLWEISGKGLKEPSYLFGTIHLIDKKDFILTDATKNSLEKAKRVTFEINMEEMSDMSVLMPLMMKAFMANGTTLRDLLKEEDYTLVKAHFEKMGLPMMLLERMKPMFLSSMNPDAMGGGLEGENSSMMSYEMELMKLAQAQKKPIAGLETAEFQMSMFDSIPYEAQAEMLVESVKSADTGNDQLKQLVDLYKKQDINGLHDMLNADSELSKYDELLLVNRNKNWIPVMGKMMGEQPTFFAVGAGHLAGANGVINLLRQAGYTIKPLK